MHVPDGFLSPAITVPAYAVSAPLWLVAARRHFGAAAADALPAIGALTALAFVVQTIRIPVPGGTSTHLVGATLLALAWHPLVAFLCESLVLAVQALFFGGGGVTTLGVNALAMGLVGPGVAWLAFRAARRQRHGRSGSGALLRRAHRPARRDKDGIGHGRRRDRRFLAATRRLGPRLSAHHRRGRSPCLP